MLLENLCHAGGVIKCVSHYIGGLMRIKMKSILQCQYHNPGEHMYVSSAADSFKQLCLYM